MGAELVGRDAELLWLRERLQPGRVIVVTGLGGIGKTALADAFAATCGLPVIALERGDDLIAPLARALGLGAKGTPEAIQRALASAPPTLVRVESAELLSEEACAELARWALPNIAWLVTS